jgi:siroheme synthase-like protein
MGYFPFFTELSGKRGLIVGGGAVALRKAEKLLPYGPRLTVVAPRFLPEFFDLPGVTLCPRTFAPSDLDQIFFAVAATDSSSLNREISALCQAQRIPVNAVDDKEHCTFLFPALVRRGDLSVGISTGGASPTAAIWLKEQIAALLPEHLEEILDWLEGQRPVLKAKFPDEKTRSRLFAQLFAACLAAGKPLDGGQVQEILRRESCL